MVLVGTAHASRRSWWIRNARGLEGLLRSAGFRKVDVVSGFDLKHRKSGVVVRHLVAHAEP